MAGNSNLHKAIVNKKLKNVYKRSSQTTPNLLTIEKIYCIIKYV